jgi:hypothetical protein
LKAERRCSIFFSCQDNLDLGWHSFTSCKDNTILYLIVLTYLVIIFYYHPFSFQCLTHILANSSKLIIESSYYHSPFVFVFPFVAVPVDSVAVPVASVALPVAVPVASVALPVALLVVRPVVMLMFVRKLSMLIVIGIVERTNYSVLKLFS